MLGLSLRLTANLVLAAHLAALIFAIWNWSVTG